MGQRINGLSKNTLLDDRFPARRLLRSLIWRALNVFLNRVHLPSWQYVSVGLQGSREQGNLRKCSPSALESALRNRGALASVPESALEGALEGKEQQEEHPREHSWEHSREHPDF